MMRAWLAALICLSSWTLLAHPAAAAGSPIATSMGDLRWGMSESEVVTFVRRKLAEQYGPQIDKAKGARQADLQRQLKRAQAEVERNIVNFTGKSSRFDHGVVGGEFRNDNGDSMLVYKDDSSENYYFFANGRLWKWYRAMGTRSFGGGSFKKFAASVEKRFGKGRLKDGELAPGRGQTKWLEFLDRNSRLRAADNTRHGVFALIFEDMSEVRSRGASSPAPRRIADDEEEEDSAPARAKGEPTQLAQAGNGRRSIFEGEQRGETDAEYAARKKRLAAEERDKQLRMHERKQDTKKGQVLQQIEGLDDKDPLGGL